MTRFFNPGNADEADDGNRLHAPATARNRAPILEVLKPRLPSAGSLLEIAAGTGEHAAYLAPHFKTLHWQATDIEEHHLASIDAWRLHSGATNILPAKAFNALTDDWIFDHLPAPLEVVMAANLIHISPFEVAEALIIGAGSALSAGGILFLYGPYKQEGRHTSASNDAFDMSLKSRNSAWGVRDMETIIDLATAAGFGAPEVIAMPANNFSLIFKKQTPR